MKCNGANSEQENIDFETDVVDNSVVTGPAEESIIGTKDEKVCTGTDTNFDDETGAVKDQSWKETNVVSVARDQLTDPRLSKEQVNVEVYATAVFENSPYSVLHQEELDSLARCIKGIDHLTRNIAGISVEGHSTIGLQNGCFQHSVQLKLEVVVANLWESARSYIWKHLGRDVWDRSNGTTISLMRIHQKN